MKMSVLSLIAVALVGCQSGASTTNAPAGPMTMKCGKCSMALTADTAMKCPPPCTFDGKMGDLLCVCKCGNEMKCSDAMASGKCSKCGAAMSQADCTMKCGQCKGSHKCSDMTCMGCMGMEKK